MNYPPKPKKVAYVVFVGHKPGIYGTWTECEQQVSGFKGARFKGYTNGEDAVKVWREFEKAGTIATKHGKQPTRTYRPKPRVDTTIAARARRLVATSDREGKGASTTTCTSASCSYPACQC